MAGHGYVKQDPAIENWNNMRENAYQRFRFTSRTTRVVLISCILIPGALLYFSNATHMRWDWTGKRKGESLKRES
ncbi:hypothetical protein PILCRDRAFT_9322 [Piloderma croceum F 1598]|uniref:NADH dehydrogenase [ubiquinone] 1 beta subcomplex subunit 4 n=1 Tax=Piloderma croceum (strain F 1598) TaxID=765440 RepID=A0A0C3BU87_PILCF|nr:hypothetical protein PILCRDRAFT_9322 [Piloderma croceum F 1598]